MKLIIFNRTKYIESLNKLATRKAPKYVIEAYKDGHITAVNEYYKLKIQSARAVKTQTEATISAGLNTFKKAIKEVNLKYLNEALEQRDLAFLKAFFKMTNMDIMTGSKLPPNASQLLKQDVIRDLGLKDLFKQLR